MLIGGAIAVGAIVGAIIERDNIEYVGEGLVDSSGGPFLHPHKADLGTMKPDATWAHFSGDLGVKDQFPYNQWPRFWHKIGIFAMKAAEINQLLHDNPGSVQAVAFTLPGNKAQVAFLNGGEMFGRYSNSADHHTEYLACSGRVAHGDEDFVGGIYNPDSKLFKSTITIAAATTTIDKMVHDYPGIGYI